MKPSKKPSEKPKREHRNSSTYQAILTSALQLFTEKGFDRASIRDIISSAQVTQPVLYYHFGSKEELYLKVLETCFNEYLDTLNQSLKSVSDPGERLKSALYENFKFTRSRPQVAALIYEAIFSIPHPVDREIIGTFGEKCIAMIATIIVDCQESGYLEEIDPEVLSYSFFGLINIYTMRFLFDPEFDLSEQLADELFALFLTGVGKKKAAEKLLPKDPEGKIDRG